MGEGEAPWKAGVARALAEARAAAGFSQRSLAAALGTSCAAVVALEGDDEELFGRYSIADVRHLAEVLGVALPDLLRAKLAETVEGPRGWVGILEQACAQHPEAMAQFERRTGGRLRPLLEQPDLLLADLTLDGLVSLCEDLRVDWRRVLAEL